MPDTIAKTSHKQPPHRRRWWLLVFSVFVMLSFAWWLQWSQRSTMRLVARIVLPPNAVLTEGSAGHPWLIGSVGGILLGVDTSNAASRPSTTFTLYGWDGGLCWQIVAAVSNPVDANAIACGPGIIHSFIALSPDGHVFALARNVNGRRSICSWRNGHILGIAYLPGADRSRFVELHATNTGQVWLTQGSPLRPLVWSVDGAQAQSETSLPSFHDVLAMWGQGGRINIISSEYMAPEQVIRNEADDDLYLRVCPMPPEQPWLVPHMVDFDGFSCQNGGRTVVLAEYDSRLRRFFYKCGDELMSALNIDSIEPHQWLAVYTAPGKLRAIQHLPSKGKSLVLALQLSPDGHRVAIIHDFRNGHKELQIYRW